MGSGFGVLFMGSAVLACAAAVVSLFVGWSILRLPLGVVVPPLLLRGAFLPCGLFFGWCFVLWVQWLVSACGWCFFFGIVFCESLFRFFGLEFRCFLAGFCGCLPGGVGSNEVLFRC